MKIMSWLAVIALVSLPVGGAKADDLPGGYTCSDLRSKVDQYGAALILVPSRSW